MAVPAAPAARRALRPAPLADPKLGPQRPAAAGGARWGPGEGEPRGAGAVLVCSKLPAGAAVPSALAGEASFAEWEEVRGPRRVEVFPEQELPRGLLEGEEINHPSTGGQVDISRYP